MKKFRFCYSKLVWFLLAVIIGLTAAGAVKSILSVFAILNSGIGSIVTDVILTAVNLFLLVFVISVSVFGNYQIKNDMLYSYFGFIRTKSLISDIVRITYFKTSRKLVIYFKQAKYSVIVISEKYYDDFIKAIREVNPAILYDAKTDGEDEPKTF